VDYKGSPHIGRVEGVAASRLMLDRVAEVDDGWQFLAFGFASMAAHQGSVLEDDQSHMILG
jgi:hypothetical protein